MTLLLRNYQKECLEEFISEYEAGIAFKQAYWAALASGSSVLMSENGNLVEIFPDGRKNFIKLSPWIPVTKGEKFHLPQLQTTERERFTLYLTRFTSYKTRL